MGLFREHCQEVFVKLLFFMAKDVLDINASLSEEIRTNYAKRDDPKYLKATILACENQIKIAKAVATEILKGEKQYTLKSDNDILKEFKKENAKDMAIISGTSFQKNILDQIDKQMAKQPTSPIINTPLRQRFFTGIKIAAEFDKKIHKSKDDYIIIPGKLGEHLGYKQLCIIREKEGNWKEVLRLAEQAKSEGWEGDWDKRIEKARKKLE